MKANGIIIRVCAALGSSTISTEHRLRLLADFKVAVVEHVIQRKGCKEKRDLETIAKEFASQIAAIVEGGCAPCNIMPPAKEE